MQSRLLAERYELITPLGRGTMGTVWRAVDRSLGRDVAVKEIRQDSGLTAEQRHELRERMIREGRTAARVRHPSVATIYDAIEFEGVPWIIMELVEGRSLEGVIEAEGPLPLRLVAEIGHDLLGALRAAHAQGILHRDVKPSNVILTDTGRVVLTDFGIAKSIGDSALTQTGMVIGSPGYTAPERARGDHTGPESDLWALGATLYYAVEGRPAYERRSVAETLTALMTESCDPPTHAGPLRPVLEGLLEKDYTLRLTPDRAAVMLRTIADTPTSIRLPGEPVAPPMRPAAPPPQAPRPASPPPPMPPPQAPRPASPPPPPAPVPGAGSDETDRTVVIARSPGGALIPEVAEMPAADTPTVVKKSSAEDTTVGGRLPGKRVFPPDNDATPSSLPLPGAPQRPQQPPPPPGPAPLQNQPAPPPFAHPAPGYAPPPEYQPGPPAMPMYGQPPPVPQQQPQYPQQGYPQGEVPQVPPMVAPLGIGPDSATRAVPIPAGLTPPGGGMPPQGLGTDLFAMQSKQGGPPAKQGRNGRKAALIIAIALVVLAAAAIAVFAMNALGASADDATQLKRPARATSSPSSAKAAPDPALKHHEDSNGFTVDYPSRFAEPKGDEDGITFGKGLNRMRVEVVPERPADLVEAIQAVEAAREQDGEYPGYQLIRIAPVQPSPYSGTDTADWEFTYEDGGKTVRVLCRWVSVPGGATYAISWQALESEWEKSAPERDAVFASFAPTLERPSGGS
ncbi:serine/threonine-protein kinase [Acrocarpospora sp. B8E8]|uniref:serine/threonine-protein kinase n=1 Tax=Acrocarpospora sp. B8E8 TaxID=3153572 RepID=UPI00325EE86C